MKKGFYVLLAFLAAAACLGAVSKPQDCLFVGTDWLAGRRADNKIVIVDANPKEGYGAGHIPGAVNLWYEDFNDGSLQCNLVQPEALGRMLGEKGIDGTETLVIYGEVPFYFGRISWMLDYLGCKDIRILDGGLTKWKKENRPVTADTAVRPPKTFALKVNDSLYATTDKVTAALKDPNAVLIDVRTDEEYNGWQLSKEPRPGHITGALHIPITSWFTPDKTIKSVQELSGMFKAAGVQRGKNLIFYCTIGGRSGLGPELVLRYLHYTKSSSNYDGSIREWGLDVNRPMEAGFPNVKLLYPVKYVSANLAKLKIIDCRPEENYMAGHIPGAVNLPLSVLKTPGQASQQRSAARVAQIVGQRGITGGDNETVLIYTGADSAPGADALLFWMLEYLGHKNVHILNGGWKAWAGSGSAVETAVNTPAATEYAGTFNPSLRITRQQIQEALHSKAAKLLELKSNNAAKIAADAVHYATTAFFDGDGTFRDHNQVEGAYKKLGITGATDAIIHITDDPCSAYGYFTLRLLGYPSMKTHDESWFD